jgi:hypothetical protein
VDAVVAGTHNVFVNAVAGSGKTTTALHVATQARVQLDDVVASAR